MEQIQCVDEANQEQKLRDDTLRLMLTLPVIIVLYFVSVGFGCLMTLILDSEILKMPMYVWLISWIPGAFVTFIIIRIAIGVRSCYYTIKIDIMQSVIPNFSSRSFKIGIMQTLVLFLE